MTLAIHGGKPVLTARDVSFDWPRISPTTAAAVLAQLDTSISIYNRSGVIRELEERMEQWHGVSHAVATNSGTSALHSLYVAANLGPEDEIICPALTFPATVSPILFTGARVVFADSGPNGNVTAETIERCISDRTRGVMIVHLWGVPCDMNAIGKLVVERGLLLFEDISHSFGARFDGRAVGSFGDGAALSLQAQKTLVAGEGGVFLCDSEDFHHRALLLGHYNPRCLEEIPDTSPWSDFSLTGMGLKLRIHPLAAAIALEQLATVGSVLVGRRRYVARMQEALGALPGICFPDTKAESEPSWYALALNYDADVTGVPLSKVLAALQGEGCATVDQPGSTCVLPLLPLFERPGDVFRWYRNEAPRGEWDAASQYRDRTFKLPVWDRPEDEWLVDGYIEAFLKVWDSMDALRSGGLLT